MASIIYNKDKTMLSSLKNSLKQAKSVGILNMFVHAVDKDDIGCCFNMLNTNYTQDKIKILKTDDERIMKDNYKLVILNVFNSIKELYNHNTKSMFSVRALSDYLNGADTKIIQTFKINELFMLLEFTNQNHHMFLFNFLILLLNMVF